MTRSFRHPDLPRTRTSIRRAAVLARTALLGLILIGIGASSPAWADEDNDPNLGQTLAPGQEIVDGEKVLQTGHVDMGPKFDADGNWRFLIHDDAAKADVEATSVWRHPERTVLRVLDEAIEPQPEDPAYDFTGAKPGDEVWVVPQTQNPDVVWLGWNTQDPDVMQRIDRGVTLSLTAVQGPGVMTTYVQSGSFGEPQVLWDSRVTDPQPVWVDVNTHTHANWVFTQPGIYLVELTAAADLQDGSSVSDTQVLRFAVGTDTDTDDALSTQWQPATDQEGNQAPASTGSPDQEASAAARSGAVPALAGDDDTAAANGTDALVVVLIIAIVVAVVALIAGLSAALISGNRAKQRALARRERTDREAVRDEVPTTGGDDEA